MTDCSPHSPSNMGPADSVLRELLPEFFTIWDRDLCNATSEILDRNDSDALYRFGHTIKGSLMQFGFRDLALFGIEIMRDAERADFPAAAERIAMLQQQLHVIRRQFV